MMDTVLNLGLNDATVEGLAAAAGDARFACDSYRRFVQMYGDVVLGVDHERVRGRRLRGSLEAKQHAACSSTPSSTAERPDASSSPTYQGDRRARQPASRFPQDPSEQLWGAIGAVFGSWKNPRADRPTAG